MWRSSSCLSCFFSVLACMYYLLSDKSSTCILCPLFHKIEHEWFWQGSVDVDREEEMGSVSSQLGLPLFSVIYSSEHNESWWLTSVSGQKMVYETGNSKKSPSLSARDAEQERKLLRATWKHGPSQSFPSQSARPNTVLLADISHGIGCTFR